MTRDTSILAYYEILESLPERRKKVLEAYMKCIEYYPEGVRPTARELQKFMQGDFEFSAHADGCWKRLAELVDKEEVLARGPSRRCTVTKKRAVEWWPKEK